MSTNKSLNIEKGRRESAIDIALMVEREGQLLSSRRLGVFSARNKGCWLQTIGLKGEGDEQDETDRFGNPVLKTITIVLRASDINVSRLNCNVFPFFIID